VASIGSTPTVITITSTTNSSIIVRMDIDIDIDSRRTMWFRFRRLVTTPPLFGQDDVPMYFLVLARSPLVPTTTCIDSLGFMMEDRVIIFFFGVELFSFVRSFVFISVVFVVG